jgi:hypothetical protein
LGDAATQTRAKELMNQPNKPFGSYDDAVRYTLEEQRQAATDSGAKSFYENELTKSIQEPIEAASQYHYMAKETGRAISANPYEYQADLAVELLKGAPLRSTEVFSPVSGEMSKYLPGGAMGVQQHQWNTALGKNETVNFMPGVAALQAAEGIQGPYGALYGGAGVKSITPESVGNVMASWETNVPRSVVTTMPAQFSGTGPDVTMKSQPMAGGLYVVPGSAVVFSKGVITNIPQSEYVSSPLTNTNLKIFEAIPVIGNVARVADIGLNVVAPIGQSFIEGAKTIEPSVPSGIIPSPYAIQSGVVSSAAKSLITGDITKMPFYNTAKSFITSETTPQEIGGVTIPSPVSQAINTYKSANIDLSKYTTDITGLGATIATAKIPETTPQGKALAFGQGLYVGAAQSPIDLTIGFGMGGAYAGLKNIGKVATSTAAESGAPLVSQIGRVASTPLASDIGRIGETGLGLYAIGSSAANIINKPSAVEMGKAAGETAIGFAGFGAGLSSVPSIEPTNQYAGREFFSGKLGISPLEKIQFNTEVGLRSLTTKEPSAYREVGTITLPVRTIEPSVKAEPRFDILSKSGKYATPIKETLVEQPHSVIGSSAFIQQYPKNIALESGIRIGKDVDVLIKSPSQALSSLSGKTGLSTEMANAVLDVHPIPPKYPGLAVSTEVETVIPDASSLSMKLFGDPYRNIAIPRGVSEVITPKEYPGKLTYEAAQVQTGRKGAAVAVAIENPMSKGYRAEKDIYDFISAYRAQRATGIAKGMKESDFAKSDAAMKSFMKREFTFGTAKGQVGTESPTKTVKVSDIIDKMKSENVGKLESLYSGRNIGGIIERASQYEPGGYGIIGKSIVSSPSLLIGSSLSVGKPSVATPSELKSVVDSSFSKLVSPSISPSVLKSTPSTPSSSASPLLSNIPSISIPSLPSSPPSFSSVFVPSVPSISPPSSTVVKSPPSVPSTPSITPPSLLPPSTPSKPGSTLSPPSVPSIPTISPPSTPKTPGSIITIPPIPLFGGGLSGAGGIRDKKKRYKPHVQVFDYNFDPWKAARITSKVLAVGSNVTRGPKSSLPTFSLQTPKPTIKVAPRVVKAPAQKILTPSFKMPSINVGSTTGLKSISLASSLPQKKKRK